MKNIEYNGFPNAQAYVKDKLDRYGEEEKSFEVLFSYMFSERQLVIAETTDGYKIKKKTYGECADKIKTLASSFAKSLSDIPQGEIVGLYMSNSIEWIECFWSILMCGYCPLLMNLRMSDDILEKIIVDYNIKSIISDSKEFKTKTHFAKDLYLNDINEVYVPNEWGNEVLFMSSGTTENVKLCAYTAENFYYQICDSLGIIENCPQIIKSYEGELKLLALLPFYHVFGFIANYIWFSFFAKTFVFLADIRPQTLLMTIRKHQVTHIFAVPLVWETIYKEANRKIKARGDKTYSKFQKALKVSNNNRLVGKAVETAAFQEVRENLFGDSIRFLISGGSAIKPEILEFFNGIGYYMVNGYGMTEIGITSVEMSSAKRVRNLASIGSPMKCTEYKISDNGELMVRGKTMASRIIQNGEERTTDFEAFFNTHDLATEYDGRYYLHGRRDDLVICRNGENLNPEMIESAIFVKGINRLCLFADKDGSPTLIISIIDCFSSEKLRKLYDEVLEKLRENNLNDEIAQIVLTSDRLLAKEDFKLSRKKVARRFANGEYKIIDLQNTDEHVEHMLSKLEKGVRECFAEALQIDEVQIGINSDFFTDLGGSSINYFALIDLLKTRYSIDQNITENNSLVTVSDFCKFIENQNK